MILHADANGFYAACETIFRPDLKGKPVIVLSNNDSIIIALNKEAKQIGLERGERFHKIRALCIQKNVAVFSSNYTLYADISRRIISTYFLLAPEVEIYSIDECFLYFPDINKNDITEIAYSIRDEIKRTIGITVSIGIAKTKTLAKFCNAIAKKRDGVFHYDCENLNALLEKTPAGDIWGIGWSRAKTLQSYGIWNALQLKTYSLSQAKKKFTLGGFNTVLELNGISAIDKVNRLQKQNITCSRQFSTKVFDLLPLEEALREYAAEAVLRMREQKSQVSGISVYLATERHDEKRFSNSAYAELEKPASFLPLIQNTALRLLRSAYRSGYGYRKVLINLHNLIPQNRQNELFDDVECIKKQESLMNCIQKVKKRYGSNALTLGSSAKKEKWHSKRNFLSPSYTTRMSDIPLVFF